IFGGAGGSGARARALVARFSNSGTDGGSVSVCGRSNVGTGCGGRSCKSSGRGGAKDSGRGGAKDSGRGGAKDSERGGAKDSSRAGRASCSPSAPRSRNVRGADRRRAA